VLKLEEEVVLFVEGKNREEKKKEMREEGRRVA
jgi:hypothetical protein